MAKPHPSIAIVIPAYNEEARLGRSVDDITAFFRQRQWPHTIRVVDDGSADGTVALVESIMARGGVPLELLRLDRNRGKGAAVRRGVLASTEELILFSDADLSTPIADVDLLLQAMEASTADGAIGSRGLKTSRITHPQGKLRQLSGKTFNLLVRLLTGLPYRDTQCGFKLFRHDCAHSLFSSLEIEDFTFDVEILYRARIQGYHILEIPVSWANSEGTRVRFFRDSLRMLRNLVRIRLHLN